MRIGTGVDLVWSPSRVESSSMSVRPGISGSGLGGIGDGSPQRCGSMVSVAMNGGRSVREPTRNSKSVAVGVTMMTSCAVDAFWKALGPGIAREILPTITL